MKQASLKIAGISLLLGALGLAVFWGVLGGDFLNYDDIQYVTQNPHVTSGFSWDNLVWALGSGYAANWHPVTWLSHMLDVEMFGVAAQGHHLVSMVLHGLNAALLFLLLQKMTQATWRSALVAALFAVHPLHVESVAWVAERKDVLSTFFGLLALISYAWYARTRNYRYYAAVALFFALGLMSKPMLVTLPFVMLLLDLWPLNRAALPGAAAGAAGETRESWQRLFLEKTPLFAMSLLSSAVTMVVQAKGQAVHTLALTPLSYRIPNALLSYLRYLAKAVWPLDLTVLYPLPKQAPVLPGLVSALLLLLVSYGVWTAAKRRRYLLVGWLWFLGMLVPVIGLVQVGLQSMADRYMYLPIVGLLIMAVWGGAELAERRPAWRKGLAAAACLVVAGYGAITWEYQGYWRDSSSLFSHAVAVNPDDYYAHYMLGNSYSDDNLLPDAVAEYQRALALNRDFADIHLNLGIVYAKQGNLDRAIGSFTTALALNPASPRGRYNLAVSLQKQGKLDQAAAQYQEALRLDPSSVPSHANLGITLMSLNRFDEAVAQLSEAIRLQPDAEQARAALSECLQRKQGKENSR